MRLEFRNKIHNIIIWLGRVKNLPGSRIVVPKTNSAGVHRISSLREARRPNEVSFLERKPMAVAQSLQLGEVHLLWHNQRRPHEEQAGQRVKDEQEVQHQQGLFTPLKCCNCLRRPV
ncbi:hypothetical protein TNCV_3465021 [Trichonephila clavipes]|nr:hypothetical protein TNCV_3465021 [Trichonephila clavipes]